MRVYKKFFKYVLPSMFAFALSGVYAIADGFFVGNALGDNALAAINIAYPLTAFLQAVGTGLGMGGAVQYALNLGNENNKRSRQYFTVTTVSLIFSGIIMTFVLLLTSSKILHLFGAEGKIFELSHEYIIYIAYGAVFQVMGTGLVPFIRNMGSSMTAMIAMIAGFMTNIILDYLFVWVFPYGMMGAAVATVVGQGVTFLVCLIFFVVKKQKFVFKFNESIFYFVKRITAVGISPFGLTFSPNITLILLNKSAVIYGGITAVSSFATVSYISCVVFLLLQGISDGGQPLVSSSYGKGYKLRTKIFKNLCYQFATITATACVIVLFLFKGHAAELFGASEQVTKNVADILPIFLAGYIFIGYSRTAIAYFYATERNMLAYILIYGEPLCLFLLLLILPNILSITGTWVSVPVSQIMVMLMSVYFMWKYVENEKTAKIKIKNM